VSIESKLCYFISLVNIRVKALRQEIYACVWKSKELGGNTDWNERKIQSWRNKKRILGPRDDGRRQILLASIFVSICIRHTTWCVCCNVVTLLLSATPSYAFRLRMEDHTKTRISDAVPIILINYICNRPCVIYRNLQEEFDTLIPYLCVTPRLIWRTEHWSSRTALGPTQPPIQWLFPWG